MRRLTSLGLVVVTVAAMFVLGSANPAKAATFVVNTTDDAPDENPGNGSCAIMEFATCSFRAALQEGAALGGPTTINFNIPGAVDNASQAHTISVNSPLPSIGGSVTVDASTQPGIWGRPKVFLDGSGIVSETFVHGLVISGGMNTVRGLAVGNFPGDGFNVVSSDNLIENNHIGSDASGNVNAGNDNNGVTVFNAADNTVEDNIIVANGGDGIYIANSGATGNEVYNNFVGLAADGFTVLANQGSGVYISGASNNIIGGPNGTPPSNPFPLRANTISGNTGDAGITICGNNPCDIDTFGTPASGNRVENNRIGLRNHGEEDRGNTGDGIQLDMATNTLIIDNVISGNDAFGIDVRNASHNATMQGNRIGTNASGTADVGNTSNGIQVLGSTSPVIDSNLIAGNNAHGVFLGGGTNAAVLVRNEIGKSGIPNSFNGVANHSAFNTAIGTGVTADGNIISFNLGNGIGVVNVTGGTHIQRNSIRNNNGIGIDLGTGPTAGVTPNETPETAGTALNFPVITEATATDGLDEIHGTVLSYPNEAFVLEAFANDSCDPSGHGEGQTFVVHTNLTTAADGTFTFGLGATADLTGKFVTATLTRLSTGVTSEFSNCQPVVTEGGSEPLEATLDLDVATPQIPSSPTRVPLGQIPLQPQAPALATAPIDLKGLGVLPLDLKGLGILPVDLKGLGILPVDLKGLGILPIDLKGLGILPVDLKGLGILPLIDLKGLGILPLVEQALCSMTLADVPIDGGWESFLADSPLAGKPLQTVRVCDLGQITAANHARLEQTGLYQLGWGNKLGTLSIYSVMLGLTSIGNINIESLDDDPQARLTWQSRLANLGFNCDQQLKRPGSASCLDTSLLELELAGVPLDVSEADGFPRLHAIPFGAVNVASAPAPVLKVKLDHIDMPNTNFGSIKIADLPNAAAVVASGCTSCVNLADAQTANKIVDTATIANLGTTINNFSLGEVAYGLVPPSARALDSMPLDTLGIETYAGPGANTALFQVHFTPQNRDTDEAPRISVTLPDSMTYRDGSVTDGCQIECSDIEATVDGNTVTFTAPSTIGVMDTYTLEFEAFSGLKLGTFATSARAQVDGLDLLSEQETVTVRDAFEPNDVLEDATAIEPGHLYISHPSRDIYEFDAPADLGSRVTVSLDHLSSDLDLVVCHPETAPPPGGAPFREPGAHQRAVALPDEGRGLVGDARILPQAGDIPIPCQGLTAGVSAHRGTDGEFVETISTTTTGKFYVQVTKYFGEENSAGANEPYSLRLNVEPPAGDQDWDPRVFLEDEDPYAGADEAGTVGTIPAQMAAGTKTIILFNKSRIADDYGAQTASNLEAKLTTFAQHPSVVGSVLSVDAVPGVRNLLQARDATPSPELNNEVVRRVLREIDARLPGDAATIQNIVIVGGDEQFPMARLFDPTIKGNESGYASDVRFTGNRNALTDSIGSGYYLSDAPYGTFSPRPFLDRFLYVPEISIGRLVETPAEIIAQLDFFMRDDIEGSINATRAAISAYDFNADLGHQATAAKRARYGDTNVTSLITEPRATNGWTADALRTAVNGAHDINLNGHFNHHALLPAAGAPVTTNEIDLGAPGTVLYSIGCHSALNVFDGYSAAGDAGPERDWPQEKATGGVYVAQTGFGYGSRGALAMHEWIIREFGRNVHTGWQTAGQSLIFAQNAYLAEGVYDVFDEKVLHTTALFGLPMFRIGQAAQPPAPAFTSAQTDPISGLPSSSFQIEPDYDAPTTSDDGTFDSIDGVSVAAAGGPRVAKTPPRDVTNQTLRAHDALPTSLVTTKQSGVNPLLDYPVLDDSVREPEPEVADVVFPDVLPQLTVNRVSTPHGERDRISAIAQQFRSTGFRPDGELVGDVESITSLGVTQFYAPASNDDFTRPTAERVEGFVQGGQGSFTIEAFDDSDIKRVVILSRDQTGLWRRSEATESASGAWLAGRQVQGDRLEFCAFIVDGAGNVLPMCDKGRLFDAVEDETEPPSDIDVDISGQAAPNAPWMQNAIVTITPPEGVTIETSLNGSTFAPYTGPIFITDEGFNRLEYRTSDERSDTILIAIDSQGPTIDVTSPEDNATYVLKQSVTPTYSCDGGPSGVESCSGPATVNTSTVGAKTYTISATDGAGYVSSRTVNYRVAYDFDGYLAPVANEPALNQPVAGQWVQMRWRLRDATGAQITSPATVSQLRSERVACPGDATPAPNVETYSNSTIYSGGRFEFVWKTKSQWANTCRNFVLTLNDGTQQTARFKFKSGLVIILYFPGILSATVTIPGS